MEEQIDLLGQIDRKLSAVLALLVDEREAVEGAAERKKSELLLADVGLKSPEIASITGKKTGAVQKAIVRARKQNRSRSRR